MSYTKEEAQEILRDINRQVKEGSIYEAEAEGQRAYVLSRIDDAPRTDPNSVARVDTEEISEVKGLRKLAHKLAVTRRLGKKSTSRKVKK